MRDAVGSGWSLTHFAEVAEASATDSAEDAETILGRLLPTVTDEQMRARLGGAAAYTVIVLKTTGAFVRPDVDPVVWEHGRRNMALVDAGLLAVVLPVTDDSDTAGYGVFAATPQETGNDHGR